MFNLVVIVNNPLCLSIRAFCIDENDIVDNNLWETLKTITITISHNNKAILLSRSQIMLDEAQNGEYHSRQQQREWAVR